MTTISAAAPTVQLPPPTSVGPALPPAPAKAAAAAPSDTVAISAPAATASATPAEMRVDRLLCALISSNNLSTRISATPAEMRVDRLLDEIKAHNDAADAIAHFSWANAAAIVGQAKTESIKAMADAYLKESSARIGIDLSGSGISVQPNTTTKGPEGDAVPSLLSMNNFSFKDNRSTYAVTAGKDGTLVGTKDGQAWKTWQITPNHAGKVNNGAQAALSTLQGLLSASKPGSPGLNLVQVTA